MNVDFWLEKFERNQRRDEVAVQELLAQGWRVHVVWECELSDVATLRRSLHSAITLSKDAKKNGCIVAEASGSSIGDRV